MRIALIQQHATDSRDENLARAVAATREAAQKDASLVAFAELAFTRFFPQYPASSGPAPAAETIPGPTTDLFAALARELGVVIIPNLYEREGDACYDSSPVIDADGSILGRTRMVHVAEYPCFHEQQYYTPGNLGAPVYQTRAGRVGVAICYDRHYPEYMRALGVAGADLVVVPQAGLVGEWAAGFFEAELRVPAFQNGYFVALCNRVGVEDRLAFSGESFVCGPEGSVRARAPKGEDAVLITDVDLAEAGQSHGRRLLMRDRRPDLYPAWLGR